MANPFAKYAQPQQEEQNPFAKYAAPQPPAAPPEEQNPFAKYAPAPVVTSGPNPFAVEGAPTEAPVEKSSLYELPKALVRETINLKGMYAGNLQRQAALGMQVPELALQTLNKIDAGEIKSAKELHGVLGTRKLPNAEEMLTGRETAQVNLRAFDAANDYLKASPEERKAIRTQLQTQLQEQAKSLSEAVELGQETKKQAAPYEARVKSLFDIKDIPDALSYVGSTVGGAFPQVVPMIAAGVLTRGNIVGPVAVGGGMELGAGTQTRVDFIADKIKDEPSPEKRVAQISKYIQDTADVTITAAIINGALDAILGPEKDIAKALAANTLKDLTRKEIIKAIPKAAASSGAQEFLTGGLQEIVQINAERQLGEQTGDAFTKENIARVVDSAMAEALGGAGVTTAFQASRAAFAKPAVAATDTKEGKAIRGLDALAEQEEKTKAAAEDTTSTPPPAARTVENLTDREVTSIQRRLFAELGRPAEESELLEAFNEYVAEQNAGLGIESGASVAGISDTGAEQPAGTAGISDTGAAATSDTGGLGTSGVSTDQLTDRTTAQPSTLDEAVDAFREADDVRQSTLEELNKLRSAVEDLGYEVEDLGYEEDQDGLNAMLTAAKARFNEASAAADAAYNIYEQFSNQAIESTEGIPSQEDVEAAQPKSEEVLDAEALFEAQRQGDYQDAINAGYDELDQQEQGIQETPATDVAALETEERARNDEFRRIEGEQKALLTKAGRIPAKNSPARKKYDELEKQRIEAYWNWTASEKKLMDAKTAQETGVNIDQVIAENVQEFIDAYPDSDYEVADYDAQVTKLQTALRSLGVTDNKILKSAAVKFDEVLMSKENDGGGIFKSLSSSLTTAVSPLVGILPLNKFGINRLNKLFNDGKITAQEYAERMTKLFEDMEDKATKKAMTQGFNRQRGFGTVIKALEDAAKKGRITPETAKFAIWLLTKNPAIANDLAISISMPKSARFRESMSGVAGFYNDTARLVRLITSKDSATGKYSGTDLLVAVHEIMHHMERMLPSELRALIRNEWRVQLQKAMDKADKEGNQNLIKYLALVSLGNTSQSSAALKLAENMIKEGTVDKTFYSLMNPSEFWAVNGSDILFGRYTAKTRFEKLRQYFKEFIEAVKSIFGLDSNDPIIKGLNAVLKGDATFVQKQMLSEGVSGLYPSLGQQGKATPEEKFEEQFASAGDLRPDVVAAIQNNDLNGALNILAGRLGGFYGELAAKLASLDLKTSIVFDNGANLAQRGIEQTVGPQLERIMNYIRVANPDFYNNWFENYDRSENIMRVRTGIGALSFDTLNAKKGKYYYPEISSEIKDVGAKMQDYVTAVNAAGAYFNLFDTITLNTKQMKGIGNRTFLHEVVHAATVSLMRADPSQLTKEQLAAREELIKAYEFAQKNIKVNEYGLTNKFEFVAELFTNDQFRKLLRGIPYAPAKTNILSRFFNAILKLVGAGNLASTAMTEAEKLFTSTRYQEAKPIGPLFAQAPKKKRVRGPISTPDTYRTANENQNTLLGVIKDAASGQMQWSDARKILLPAVWEAANVNTRKTLLYVANLTQLEDLTRTKFSQLTGALKIIRDMVAYRAKKLNVASDITRRWVAAQSKNYNQSQLMGRIMLEATIRGIDPDTAQSGTLNKPLQDAWNTLNPDFKQIYRDVRNFYTDSVNEMIKEMKLRASQITDSAQRDELLRKIDAQFGPDKLIKPYFPMRRFGEYWFQVGSGNFKEFYEFESPIAREVAMRKRIAQLSKGNKQQQALADTIRKGNGISALYGQNRGTTQVLNDVNELVQNISATDVADLKVQLEDSLNQLVYLLLPQQSMRKMFINRKAIQGASADMLRVFATSAVHSAYQQSRFKFAEGFITNLNNARDEIDGAEKSGALNRDQAAVYRDFIAEVEKRVPTIMSNEDTSFTAQAASKASELTFYYMLSAPFTAMLNHIGAVQIAMPYLGGTYGYVKANAVLLKNMGRYLATTPSRTFAPLAKGQLMQVNFPSIVEGGKLDPLMQRAADRFIDDGQIDISMTNDIMDLGGRPSEMYTGVSANIKKAMSGLFHQSERLNREVFLLSTFELAYEKYSNDFQRQPGMEGLKGVNIRDAQGNKIKNTPDQAFELAIEEATRTVALTLGDYSRQMKGRVFANPVMNVLLKFKQYPIMALYISWRNFHLGAVAPFQKAELDQYRTLLETELSNAPNKDEIIEQRMQEVEDQRKAMHKEGRRRLAGIFGMSILFGGVAATPIFSLVIGTLVKMFGNDDDDEFFDWENWFYNYMETEFGGYAAAMLTSMGMEEDKAEKVGRATGEVVSRGVPTLLGANLSDRVSLDPKNLLWRDGRYSPDIRENVIETMIANAGPVVGLALNFADAAQLIKEGQYARAAEKLTPAIIAKPLSAVRMSEEGARTKGGDVLLNDLTATELAMQAIGLQPDRLAQKQKAAVAMKQKEQKIKDERSAIMNRLWLERDNPEGFSDALDRAIEFSAKHPGVPITGEKINKSFQKRARRAAEVEAFGADLDKKLRPELMDMGDFADDE